MHSGVISFCDRVGHNIKCPETKDAILAELEGRFGIRILQKHWYRIDARSAPVVVHNPHAVCLRSNGNPYYMFFTRFQDVPVLLFIDKKVQPGYDKPRIILCRGMFHAPLFDSTVLDGEMVRDREGRWVFLVNDLVAACGRLLDAAPLPERLALAQRVFGEWHTPDACQDVCSYQVKRYAHCSKEGVRALLALADGLPYTSRGIYFWPFQLRYKPKLFNFDESLIKIVPRRVKDVADFREDDEGGSPRAASAPTRVPEPAAAIGEAEAGARTLWLRKTEQPDVYDVLDRRTGGQRLGVAQVSSLATSRLLRAVFREATAAVTRPFECVFDVSFQKWRPIAPACEETGGRDGPRS